MRPKLPEKSDVYRVNYQDVISRIGEIFSMIIGMEDPKPVYDHVLKSMGELFELTEMVLSLVQEGGGSRAVATHGFDEETARTIMNYRFPDDWYKWEMQEEFRITKNGYLVDGESWAQHIKENPQYELVDVYKNPDRLTVSRESPEQWHEGDFFEFIIRDDTGKVIGYLEIADSMHPDLLPPRGLIEMVDAFSQILGTANRIWKQTREDRMRRESRNFLAMLLSNELKPLLSDAMANMAKLERRDISPQEFEREVNASSQQIEHSLAFLKSAKQIIDIESRPYSLLTLTSMALMLQKWKDNKTLEGDDLAIDLSIEGDRLFAKVDNRFPELLSSTLALLDARALRGLKRVRIRMFRGKDEKWIGIAVSSDDVKDADWRAMRALLRAKGTPQAGLQKGSLPIFMMRRIISEYGGEIDLDWGDKRSSLLLRIPAA